MVLELNLLDSTLLKVPSKMPSFDGYRSLSPKTKNIVVAGGLAGFVLGVYYYTMRAVGSTDELQVAIDKFEEAKRKEAETAISRSS
ncbi:hypothetical protein HPP92_011173 [Vanilla planifolia]|uniref:Cytochrome c oxidase assembly factor 3 mitochondrial coiled-coil domain-containing protein n=1 Tax=Vanilla planifolia TaxID=51239 RepID=A0A835R6J3_VANPL|nr:hypothetical protein HPP92_011173 [Vanilla planifolia]